MPSSLPLIKFSRSASQYFETALPAGSVAVARHQLTGLLYIEIHSIPTATLIATIAQEISTSEP
jgi:hypothetical protein